MWIFLSFAKLSPQKHREQAQEHRLIDQKDINNQFNVVISPRQQGNKQHIFQFCTLCVSVCVYNAVKLEPAYSKPSRVFKVREIFKE